MLIVLATKYHWKLHQLDVKSAFLNGELKEEVYLTQPKGFVEKRQEHLVCKLNKALYGLKQAPRSWHEKIDSFFLQQGFMRRKSDPNLYTKFDENGYIVLISLYVDDLIITGNVEKLIIKSSTYKEINTIYPYSSNLVYRFGSFLLLIKPC